MLASRLGDDAVAAVAIGGHDSFFAMVLPIGIMGFAQPLVAQAHGSGDATATRRIALAALALATLVGILYILALPFIGDIVSLIYPALSMRVPLARYIAVRLSGAGLVFAFEGLLSYFGGIGRTKVVLAGSVIVASVGLGLTALSVAAVPRLGVVGPALGAVVGTGAGLAFLVVAYRRHSSGNDRTRIDKRDIVTLLRAGTQNGLMILAELSAYTFFLNMIVSEIAVASRSALLAALQLNMVAAIPAAGLAASGGITIGHLVGANDRVKVVPFVLRLCVIVVLLQTAIGVLYLVWPRWLFSLFNVPPSLVARGGALATLPFLCLCFLIFDGISMTATDALRALKDTSFCLWCRVLLAWGLLVPVAWFTVRVKQRGVVEALLCLVGYLLLCWTVLLGRLVHQGNRGVRLMRITDSDSDHAPAMLDLWALPLNTSEPEVDHFGDNPPPARADLPHEKRV